MINSMTQLNLVIGYPLSHTRSPQLHKEIYRLKECNAVLLARPTTPEELSTTVEMIRHFPVKLTAVTLPHKEAVLKLVDEQSEEVKALGAANTIINHNNKLTAYNTDINGIEHALRNIDLKNKTALILGAGGAARAAAYVLKKNKVNILYLNRTLNRAEILSKHFGGKVIHKADLVDLDIDIIINATSIGMHPNIDTSPLPDYKFNKSQIIFDMVYNPIDTLLLQKAKADGATIISGEEMFLGQALKQIELYMEAS
ncbi:MAG TPA: shikimate dehydrogenase [Gammaproteobacteria bacterium]|nr:shikimate dehydrogenase [Gammaproteobacteria bacterium]